MCTPRPPEVFGQPSMPNSCSSSRTCGATQTASPKSVPGCGSRSMRIRSGCSTSPLLTGHGWKVSVPRLAHQATTATESGAISSAVRPLGKVMCAVGTQLGAFFVTRFRLKASPGLSTRVEIRAPSKTPPGQRSSVVGRSRRAFRMPSPTATKYSTTSILRMPLSPKYGFSGLETRTSWPSMSRTTASLLLAMFSLTAGGRRVSRRTGQAVHRRGQVDQVVVHRRGDALGLGIGRVPLPLPDQQDAVVEVLGHVLGTRQRGDRVTGVADDEERRAA